MDADGFAGNTEPAMVILTVDRRDIEAGNVAKTLSSLHILTDSAGNVRLYRESVVFQIDGYNDDPRQLPEIPEVRAFYNRLVAEWPHWLWFLARDFGSIALLLSLLCRVRVIPGKTGFGTEFHDLLEVQSTLRDMLHRGNALFAAHDIGAHEAKTSAESAMAEIVGGLK